MTWRARSSWFFCNTEIDSNEDGITQKNHEKDDLEGKKLGLENAIASLNTELDELKKQVADSQVALKQAGEDRKAENVVFQQSISDQRATINVLNKASDRLSKFYSNATLLQKNSRQEPEAGTEPGAAVEAPPPKPEAYAKSGGGGGVLQMLAKITQDAAREEAAILKSEQGAQASYEALVKDMNEVITADQKAIVHKSKLVEESTAA